MKTLTRAHKALTKKAKKGFKGYPIATIALYGPTNKLATKIVVGIFKHEGDEPTNMRKWHSETDIKNHPNIMEEILQFVKENEVSSIIMTDKIIGCPHQEGIDYSEGTYCLECLYWKDKTRWGSDP